MRAGDDLAERAALSLIAADARFFRDLAQSPRLNQIRPVASLALMPFLSAFVYESARFIRLTDSLPTRKLKTHNEMLVTSRMRLKFIEDKYKSPAEVLENSHDLAAVVSRWFLEGHRGIGRRLKRLIQPDLGIFFIQNEAICTTHVAFLNMGFTEKTLFESSLSMDDIGPYMQNRMVDVGEYVGLLLHELAIDAAAVESTTTPPSPPVQYRDIKSKRFYNQINRRLAPGRIPVSILLTSVLSQINTARLLVPKIAQKNEVAALKLRFVSLFQTVSSFRKLLEEERHDSFLHPRAVQVIGTILNDNSVRIVGANRRLRNNLLHYGVDKRAAATLSPNLPLSGLVEALANGKSLQAMEKEVEHGLDHVSEMLRSMLPRTLTREGKL